jgi:hypothetical protein
VPATKSRIVSFLVFGRDSLICLNPLFCMNSGDRYRTTVLALIRYGDAVHSGDKLQTCGMDHRHEDEIGIDGIKVPTDELDVGGRVPRVTCGDGRDPCKRLEQVGAKVAAGVATCRPTE